LGQFRFAILTFHILFLFLRLRGLFTGQFITAQEENQVKTQNIYNWTPI
jgi:hypothetical protein